MKNKYSNNIIISIFILSIILSPYLVYIQNVNAQLNISSKKGVQLDSLMQCKDVSMSTKILFGSALGTMSSLLEGENIGYATGKGLGNAVGSFGLNYAEKYLSDGASTLGKTLGLDNKLNDVVDGLVGSSGAVNVTLKGTPEAKDLEKIKKTTEETQKDITKMKDQSTCIAAVGRIITKMLLQKLTLSTVNWIKSGFEGSPAFIQNPSKFFKDLAKAEVLQFGSEITASGNPFGKEWLKNTASAFNNKFQENAQYSLDEMIKNTTPEYSAIEFQEDFSKGGWNAWNAMTQTPTNNPLGFKIMADVELEKRLRGTSQSSAEILHETLSQANGFLGDQRCADPKGVTKEEHEKGLVERTKYVNKKGDAMQYVYVNRLCNRWEYVTPGVMIAEAATSTMNTTKDSLLAVEDLNDSIAAISDALLAQFSSDLMEKGFAELSTNEFNGSINFNSEYDTGQANKDFTPSQLSSSWLSNNPNFDIRTDLTQSLIDEQRTYINKLIEQNKALISTKDGKEYKLDNITGESNADGLIPTIYQLDYCIPGPHPGWENDAKEVLNKGTEKILSYTTEMMKSNSFVDGFLEGLPIIGDLINNSSRKDAQAAVRRYYGGRIQDRTGIGADPKNDGDLSSYLASKEGAVYVLNTILDRYINLVNKTYDKNILPSSSVEASTAFKKIIGYKEIIKENEEKISSLKTTIKTLSGIKDDVDNLNLKYPDKGDDYENELKFKINEFGRISKEMINGNDITKVDDLTKQINDEKIRIYKYLLKGEYGCEKDLENNSNLVIYNTRRMEYPFPILYDYITGKTNIPDPMKLMKTVNKFNSKNNTPPGFLPYNAIIEIKADDLFPLAHANQPYLNGLVFESILAGKKTSSPLISAVKNEQQSIPNDDIIPGLY